MLKSIQRWLRSAPIRDPIDQRNAPVMQVLLAFVAVSTVGLWLLLILRYKMPTGGWVAANTGFAVSASALLGCYLIRRGAFRPAIYQFLATLLICQEIIHLSVGFQMMVMSQIDQMLTLIVSALVLGRRTLWLCHAALCFIAFSGCVVDTMHLPADAQWWEGFRNLPSVIAVYTLIAVVLDHTVTTLRESLQQARQRGEELQQEMSKREQAQNQLIHAQKMEATGRLAAGIAHDFGNLLNIVHGFSQQRHLDDASQSSAQRALMLEDALQGVEEAADRGLHMTRKLLSFSRSDLLKAETFDINQSLRELQPMLRQLLPPEIQLRLDACVEPLPIHLDRNEFELIVLNIAANARDAMPDGGSFRIVTRRSPGNQVQLQLADTGSGMPEQIRERIFEPFFSTKKAGDGTGLGLSITHDLIKVAGGHIEVDSAPGRGCCFDIRLPMALPPDSGVSALPAS
ncbi:sensor histidine kinase [Pseudoxanthomonas dokdonensis]|uniref:histidine kinase n=1 Tax=Pseudoxanthomonas dokdonensis TaxID=344882 RepID=A0A0R0CJN6_9GAMM|nr:ATP-binding protein [Pseudoxanthomonas dokdonensis]KRG70153.1 hypothetical protein ABB29_08020 [Pseudoxanthomonas dokdonensis]